jgi:serine/threonine protein kinase
MAAPTTGIAFLELLRKSNLVSEDRLAAYLATVPYPDRLAPTDLAGRMVQDRLLTRFQAHHLLKGRHKNFLFGSFRVLEPLGGGGMSQVFLCEHTVDRTRFAVKLLPARDPADPTAAARAGLAIDHPNVVRAHAFDRAEGKFYYLVMDYVDGVNLRELVQTIGPLPAPQAAHYVAQAAAGLQHVADRGLVHGEVRPSNLMLNRAGTVKLLDLGLAGAPADTRADVTGLGATFLYLLTGQGPGAEPEPLEGVPDAVRDIVRGMLHPGPVDRFPNPASVIAALAPWTATPLPPPSDSYFPRRSGAWAAGSTVPVIPSSSTPTSSWVVPSAGGSPASGEPASSPDGSPWEWSRRWLVVAGVVFLLIVVAVVLAVLNPFKLSPRQIGLPGRPPAGQSDLAR